jgi:hypothetical protein
MSGSKILLVFLQILGGLSILPYPFILLANVMSIAAPRQNLLGAVPYILLSVYPAVWIGLYLLAWRAISKGGVAVAFTLSSIPVLFCLCGLGWYLASERGVKEHYTKAGEDMRKQVEPVNPLLWTIMRCGGEDRLYRVPGVPVEEALKAIDANPSLVNVGVPPHGTPLRNALLNISGLNFDGSLRGNGKKQRDLFRVVRALVEHGAKLEPEERANIWRSWQLRRALFEGEVTTASENPLVWRIVTRKVNDTSSFEIGEEEGALVNKPTRLHGSPVYAALLTNGFPVFATLVKAGAWLTIEEQKDPAAISALTEMLRRSPELERIYRK